MKKKLSLFASLIGLMVCPLSGCEYKYNYSVPAYPTTSTSADDGSSSSSSTGLPTVLPTSLKLSLESKTIKIGESFKLFAELAPYNATDKTFSWLTSNMYVASVSGDGEVTGNGIGTAIITAKSNAKPELTASCSITVEEEIYKVTDIKLSASSETIKVGGVADLFATVYPENATNKAVNWLSSNESIVTVENGKIRGVAPGAAVVSVATVDQGKMASCTVRVKSSVAGQEVLPTSVSVSPTNKSTTVGDTFQIVPTVLPENADDRTVKWSSSNISIATVAPSGLVTTHAAGTAIITATSSVDASLSASCEVTVGEQVKSVTAVVLSETSKTLEIGESFSLTATVLPPDAANRTVVWDSSVPAVASVSNGVVKALKSGSTVITATSEADPNKKASCAVVVKADPTIAEPGFEDTGVEDAGTYDIKIWCDERIESQIKTQVSDFVNHFAGKYTINLTVDPVSEGNAATSMTEDVGSGADIFIFAQDQLSKLKTSGALTNVTGAIKSAIVSETEAEGIEAASISGKMWAYPFTSDNGYFMYYDKRVVKESSIGDIELIIKDCQAEEKKFNYNIFGNGFYTASYFMATGCHSNWVMDATNKFSSFDDNYNSESGVLAAKGIQYLKANNIFANSDDPSKFGRPKNGIGACVTGIWNYKYAYDAIGENLGCAPMPSFTLSGKKYHISSFSGYKLLGVKPQQDAKKVSLCKRLARYLSSEVCQLERFNEVNWGPTNINALANEKVRSHPGLAALRAQKPYSKPQVQCPSSWFSSVSTLAAAINAESDESEIRTLLAQYEENLESLLSD